MTITDEALSRMESYASVALKGAGISVGVAHDALALVAEVRRLRVERNEARREERGVALRYMQERDEARTEVERLTAPHPMAPKQCPSCEWSNSGLLNYATTGPRGSGLSDPIWLCHGCAARRIETGDAAIAANAVRSLSHLGRGSGRGLLPRGSSPEAHFAAVTSTVPVAVRPKRSGRYMSSTKACGCT